MNTVRRVSLIKRIRRRLRFSMTIRYKFYYYQDIIRQALRRK